MLLREVHAWSRQLNMEAAPQFPSSLPTDLQMQPVLFLTAALLRFAGVVACLLLLPAALL